MKKIISAILVCLLICAAVPFAVGAAEGDAYDSWVKSKIGTAPTKSYLSVSLKFDEIAYVGQEITVSAAVNAITVPNGATTLSFDLYYDKSMLEPTVSLMPDNIVSDSIFTTVPDDAWFENVSTLDKNTGVIKVFIANATDMTQTASGNGKLVVKVTFKTKAKGSAGVWVPHTSVQAYDKELVRFYGTGTYSVKNVNELVVLYSLGAKINPTISGLRFGATYTASLKPADATVKDLGMLIYPAKFMEAGDVLTLNYSASDFNMLKIGAMGIENFVSGQNFSDYDEITFYVTIVGIPESGKVTYINARPYVIYTQDGEDTVYYGEMLSRSYNYVLNY